MDLKEKSPPGEKEITDHGKALELIGFADIAGAWNVLERLEKLAAKGLEDIFPFLASALGEAADPDRSLINFERLVENQGEGLFVELKENPRLIDGLIRLFSASPFLTEIVLKTPDPLKLLAQRPELTQRKTIEDFQQEAVAVCSYARAEAEQIDELRRYQRRQILRIGASDFLGLYDLRTVLSQLSRMAAGLVRACTILAGQQTGIQAGDLSVLALGKLGGWELNYSSDIDLLFTSRIDSEENNRLAKKIIDYLSRATQEGFLYRVDVRLRPWGFSGPLVNTINGYVQYMQQHARLWEKQAFMKARTLAGNLSVGEELRAKIEPFLFNAPAAEVKASVLTMKLRTEEFLREKGRRWGEVKLGQGSIRDIEFVVQALQLTHPSVRTRATLKAIRQLRQGDLLTAEENRVLTDGYIFLRTTEHYLQMIDYRQTYSLPTEARSLELVAKRLGFEGEKAGEQFVERYERHCSAIRAVFMKYLGDEPLKEKHLAIPAPAEVEEHLIRMDSSYAANFTEEEILQHARMAEKLGPQALAIMEARAIDPQKWQVTIIGYDYLGEMSLICGLFFVYGMDIVESQAFTYAPKEASETFQTAIPARSRVRPRSVFSHRDEDGSKWENRQKIVDVFRLKPVSAEPVSQEKWENYASDLQELFRKLQNGQRREAQGELAKRVGAVFQGSTETIAPLYPIEIEIDNQVSERYTVLKIDTQDTVGFMYEFSNALALNHINIVRMDIRSVGKRVKDIFHVNDDKGKKITSEEKQRELRAAIVLIKHFTHLLPHSPNPEAALLHFREFLRQLFTRPNWPHELAKLERPEVLDGLATLLGVSDFLWDDFLRMQYSNLFPLVRDMDELAAPKSMDDVQKELETSLASAADWREGLNTFKDREMFRIDMRHILGHTREFWDFSAELSHLAEAVVREAYQHCFEELRIKYGMPAMEDGQPCQSGLFALGKLGGRELGFASDIELMLIYAGEGKTAGPNSIPTSKFYGQLIHDFVNSISARQEGIFHIDLQLRPYGKAGSMAVTLESFRTYYAPDGPAWAYERQALVKMRALTGEEELVKEVTRLKDEYVFRGGPFDVTAMRAMREKQIRHLVTAGTFNAKYSPGGLVDLEYLVQGLQINHGADNADLKTTNIRAAMAALHEAGRLTNEEYGRLRKAHTFLRWLIDSLRVVRGNTKEVNIPDVESEEFAFLARRLKYGNNPNILKEELAKYPADVLEISQRLLGG